MSKEIRKTIRFTSDEYKAIEKKLSQLNVDFSTFARSAILRRKIRTRCELDTLYHLSKIGNNINQLARIANTHLKKYERIPFLKLLNELEKEIKRISNVS